MVAEAGSWAVRLIPQTTNRKPRKQTQNGVCLFNSQDPPPVTYFPSKATPPQPLQMALSRDQVFKWQRVWGGHLSFKFSQHLYIYIYVYVYMYIGKQLRDKGRAFAWRIIFFGFQQVPYTQSIPARKTQQLRFRSPLHWPMTMAASFYTLCLGTGWQLLYHPNPAQWA